MGIVIAATAVGAAGLAATFAGLSIILRHKNGIGRRADRLEGSDPALAAELRGVQAQIDAGLTGITL